MKKLVRTFSVLLALLMIITALPVFSAGALETTGELTLNKKQHVKTSGKDVVFSFTPENDGWYEFYSKGESDTYAYLSDGNGEVFVEGEDSEINGDYDMNFSIKYNLKAATTYYIHVNAYIYDSAESFYIYVKETVGVVSGVVTKNPVNMTCIQGDERRTADISGLEIDFTLSDGSIVKWRYNDDYWAVNGTYVYVYPSLSEDSKSYNMDVTCGEAQVRLTYTIIENPIERIEFVSENPIVYYENTNGYVDENGNYIYSLSLPDDSSLNVYYKDGSTDTITGISDNYSIGLKSDQYNNPWKVGTNYFTLSYRGVSTEVAVEIITSCVKEAVVHTAPNREYTMSDAQWGYTNSVGRYEFTPGDLSGLSFTLTYTDGTTETFTQEDIDMETQTIKGEPYEIKESYAVKPMKVKATLSYKGFDIEYYVNVVEAPIKSMEVVWGADNCFFEDSYAPLLYGIELKITYADDTEKVVKLDKSNTKYVSNPSFKAVVTVGDLKIDVYAGSDGSNQVFCIFECYDVWAYFDGYYVEPTRDIENIDITNFTVDADNMVVDLTYADGQKQTLTLEALDSDKFDGSYYVITETENGVLCHTVTPVKKSDGTEVYMVDILGEEFEFEKVSYELGDVDMDSSVTILDATAIALHKARIKNLSNIRLELADVDKDGDVSIMDATQIQLDLAQVS